MARRVLWFDEVGSTNDVAVLLAERGESEGTVVAADTQTAGRGRLGRSWSSPIGAGVYFSVILRPPTRVPLLTLAAGVAVAQGLQAATGLTPDLKWPNDVYVGNRKLAGILAEGGTSKGSIPFVVLGIGINVLAVTLPSELASRATSVEAELGRSVERELVFAHVLVALAERYGELCAGQSARLHRAWRDRAGRMLDRTVEWDDRGTRRSGVARDIDQDGALIVESASGTQRIIAGEVTWR